MSTLLLGALVLLTQSVAQATDTKAVPGQSGILCESTGGATRMTKMMSQETIEVPTEFNRLHEPVNPVVFSRPYSLKLEMNLNAMCVLVTQLDSSAR